MAKYLLKLWPEITQKTHVSGSGARGALVGKITALCNWLLLIVFGKVLKKNELNKQLANAQAENKIVYELKRNPEIGST